MTDKYLSTQSKLGPNLNKRKRWFFVNNIEMEFRKQFLFFYFQVWLSSRSKQALIKRLLKNQGLLNFHFWCLIMSPKIFQNSTKIEPNDLAFPIDVLQSVFFSKVIYSVIFDFFGGNLLKITFIANYFSCQGCSQQKLAKYQSYLLHLESWY